MARRTRKIVIIAALMALISLPAASSHARASTAAGRASIAVGYSSGIDPWVLYSHRCRVIGGDVFGNQGVACGDLFYAIDGLTSSIVFKGQNEVLCQNSAKALVQCAGIHETAALCSLGPGGAYCVPQPGVTGVCGAMFGHSPCGVRRVVNTAGTGVGYSLNCYPDHWGDALNTSIVLPSGVTVGGPGANEASDHYPGFPGPTSCG